MNINKERVEALVGRAMDSFKKGLYEQAEAYLEDALTEDFNNVNALNLLGITFLRMPPAGGNGPERGIRCFLKALDLSPENPSNLIVNLAEAYKLNDCLLEAVELMKKYVSYTETGDTEEDFRILSDYFRQKIPKENILTKPQHQFR